MRYAVGLEVKKRKSCPLNETQTIPAGGTCQIENDKKYQAGTPAASVAVGVRHTLTCRTTLSQDAGVWLVHSYDLYDICVGI